MSKIFYPRIAVGDGKFCYSGPNCRRHGTPVKEENSPVSATNSESMIAEGLTSRLAVFERIVHSGRHVKELYELGSELSNKNLAARKCVEHGGYHVYEMPSLISSKEMQAETKKIFVTVAESVKVGKISQEEAASFRHEIKKNLDTAISPQYAADCEEVTRFRNNFRQGGSNADVPKIDSSQVNDADVLEYWQCGRKSKHVNTENAQKSINSLGKEGLTVYQCSHCSKFHTGHGVGGAPVSEQLKSGREHWNRFPDKSNMFAFAKNLI